MVTNIQQLIEAMDAAVDRQSRLEDGLIKMTVEFYEQILRPALVEQLPRVLDMTEFLMDSYGDDDALWVEDKDCPQFSTTVTVCYSSHRGKTAFFYQPGDDQTLDYPLQSYNKRWRVWTKKPTDEQRMAVKWECLTGGK